MKFTTKVSVLIFSIFFAIGASAQDKKPASPPATAKGNISGATITIDYSSPSVKGRKIWGELVPYDKVWRAGANAPTTIEIDKALKFEGKELAAGKYSVYVIPENGSATVIFGKDPKMSAYNYDKAQDALRVQVKTKKSEKMHESLVYTVNKNNITLSWENLDIPVAVK
ncbi:MAG: hypothetical protein DI539_19970 [Flavobacterium psychrophilum]|nr:MAG: hypothetical protein DI539_19970 [Flavobacterium psychrophilum]